MLRQLLLLLLAVTLFHTDAQSETEQRDKQQQQQQQQLTDADDENCDIDPTTEDDEWTIFKMNNTKQYPNEEEELRRREIWKANVKKIAEHNLGSSTYTQAANNFTDWTDDEFGRLLGSRDDDDDECSRPEANCETHDEQVKVNNDVCKQTEFTPSDYDNLPTSIDWRNQSGVTNVKNQGEEGTCYAFSAIAAMESQLLIYDGVEVDLSEQQIVDCSLEYGNHGINRGMPYKSLSYITESDKGSIDEYNYPYTRTDGSCRYNQREVEARIGGCERVPAYDETALMAAVALRGPVSAIIYSAHLQFYSDGVFSDDNCTFETDHAVLVVGYGRTSSDANGIDYWIIKNSWGVSWGDQGYFKLARNQNMCNVSRESIFPYGVELVGLSDTVGKKHRGRRSS